MSYVDEQVGKILAELEALPSPAAPTNFLRSYGQDDPPAWLTELGAKAKALGEVGFDQYCNGPWLQGFEAEVAALIEHRRAVGEDGESGAMDTAEYNEFIKQWNE